MIKGILDFSNKLFLEFYSGLPSVQTTIFLIALFSAVGFLFAYLSSLLKTKKELKTGYTRKFFHFLVFISVAVINYYYGFSGVCIFGLIISLFVFVAILRKKSSGLYLALARESDSPHETLYIIIPYFSTLIGGISINYFFPEFVILGYLITGIGDASGEVIGTMYGKHRYRIRILNFHNSYKSIEGSSSVFIITMIVYVFFVLNQFNAISLVMFLSIILASFIIVATEIFTPKGFDNLSIQIIAVLAYKIIIL